MLQHLLPNSVNYRRWFRVSSSNVVDLYWIIPYSQDDECSNFKYAMGSQWIAFSGTITIIQYVVRFTKRLGSGSDPLFFERVHLGAHAWINASRRLLPSDTLPLTIENTKKRVGSRQSVSRLPNCHARQPTSFTPLTGGREWLRRWRINTVYAFSQRVLRKR